MTPLCVAAERLANNPGDMARPPEPLTQQHMAASRSPIGGYVMSTAHASRRGLLRALTAMPIAGIPVPFPNIPASEWQAALGAWRRAEADLLPIRDRFNAAEVWYFGAKSNPLAAAEFKEAVNGHNSQLHRCDAALEAMLNTRPPNVDAVLFKVGLIAERHWDPIADLLHFLGPDLHALEAAHFRAAEGGLL